MTEFYPNVAGDLKLVGALSTSLIKIDPLLMPFRITGVFLRKFTTDVGGGAEYSILAQSRYYLQPTVINGLGIPKPNVRESNTYRRDGALFSGLNITSRTVQITIPVIGDIQAKRAEIFDMFSQDPSIPLDTYYNLYLELDTGFLLVLHKVILDAMTDNLGNPRAQLLTISFFSADPWWYGTTLKRSTYSKGYNGLYDTPLYTEFTVQSLGTGLAYPTITVTGQSYLFRIINTDTQQSIGPVYLSCAPGEVITIVTSPTQKRGIFSNNHLPLNIIDHVGDGNLDFWLDPGFPTNHIYIDGYVTGGTVTVTLEWYDSYLGV